MLGSPLGTSWGAIFLLEQLMLVKSIQYDIRKASIHIIIGGGLVLRTQIEKLIYYSISEVWFTGITLHLA